MSQTKVTDALRNVTAVDGTKINAVDGAKITTGTIPEARITSLDATKLTGNIANARIPASAVTQHVTGYNDASIRADILKLALHQAIDGNRAAYNLEDSFIDGFEDDTGITTETNVDRDTTGEHVSSIQTTSYGTQHTVTPTATANHSTTQAKFGATSIYTDAAGKLSIADHSDFDAISGTSDFTIEFWIHSGVANRVCGQWDSSNATSLWTVWMGGAGSQIYWNFYYGSSYVQIGGGANVADNSWHHVAGVRNGSTFASYIDGSLANSTTNSGSLNACTEPIIFGEGKHSGGGGHTGYLDDIRISDTARYTGAFTAPSAAFVPDANTLLLISSDTSNGSTTFTDNNSIQTVSATGTLISDPQTASTSRTSASGVIIYEDGAGTSTLGTDLKIYFTANNGTNWTEAASYGTATTYSGTKKLVKLGATTVTAGTSIAMKAEWANQSSSGITKTVTAIDGTHHDNVQAKIGSTSIFCDGTNDEIEVADSADFAFAGDYTVEFWVYFNGAPANNAHICGQGGSSASDYAFMCRSEGSGNFIFGTSNGSTQRIITAGVNIASQWAHVAMVKSGTSQKLYVNGTQAGSTLTHSDVVQNVSAPWEFGGGNASASHISAWWEEIRFSNVARYTGNFTAFGQNGGTVASPTAFTTDANTVLLIHGDGSNGSTTMTDTSAIAGKEAHLHGWAVNY